MNINWNDFKEYKASRDDINALDNFQVLLEFIRSYYNIQGAYETFDLLNADALAQMMLQKRDITQAEELEKYLFK